MKLLTAEEVKSMLGFKSIQTIYRLAKGGRIRAVHFGTRSVRFCAEEIEKVLRSGTPFINLEAGKPIPVQTVSHRRIRAWE